ADWFSPDRLQRMLDFRQPQRLIGLASTLLGFVVLAALAWWAPRRLSGFMPRRPLLAAAPVAAGLALVTAVASLPLGLIAVERAREADLVTQSIASWLADWGRGTLISVVL